MSVPLRNEPVASNLPQAGAGARFGGNTTPRIAALDGLRGIAVLLVVVVHYYSVVPTPPDAVVHDLLRRASSLFFCGVDLFFVLSGFFIGGILLDNRDSARLLPAFYLRRFLRIVPLYFLLIGTVLIGRHIGGLNSVYHGAYFTSALPDWTYFTFTQNIAMAWQREMGPHWLSVTWSLAIEEQFYLLLPLVMLRLNRRHLVIACLTLIALSPILRTVALLAPNGFAAIFLLPMRADGLLCGVLCAIAARSPEATAVFHRYRRMAALAVLALTAAIPLFSLERWSAASLPVATLGYTLLSAYFALILLLVLNGPETRLAAALRFRPLAAIGVTSYFIYLFHRPIWYTLHWLFFHAAPSHFTLQAGGVTCLALLVTFGAAAASWRWIETPLLRLARRFPYR